MRRGCDAGARRTTGIMPGGMARDEATGEADRRVLRHGFVERWFLMELESMGSGCRAPPHGLPKSKTASPRHEATPAVNPRGAQDPSTQPASPRAALRFSPVGRYPGWWTFPMRLPSAFAGDQWLVASERQARACVHVPLRGQHRLDARNATSPCFPFNRATMSSRASTNTIMVGQGVTEGPCSCCSKRRILALESFA